MPTTNYSIPTYTTSDTAALDTLLNGQANAIDTAILSTEGYTVGTDAQRLALTAPRRKEGLEWYSTDTNKRWFYDGSAWISNDPGMYLIEPTSVTGGTVTNGLIVPTTSGTGTSINGVFTSRFNAYKMVFQSNTAANAARLLRLRAAGSDYTGANYNQRGVWQNGASLVTNDGNALTYTVLSAPDATYVTGELLFTGMAAGNRKAIGGMVNVQSPIGFHNFSESVAGVDATAYDGITFYPSTSTWAAGGWIKFYGLAG